MISVGYILYRIFLIYITDILLFFISETTVNYDEQIQDFFDQFDYDINDENLNIDQASLSTPLIPITLLMPAFVNNQRSGKMLKVLLDTGGSHTIINR